MVDLTIKTYLSFRPLESPLKILLLAPIWCFYIYSFNNGISLNKNITKFAFVVSQKKRQFSKMDDHFDRLYRLNRLRYRPGIGIE